MKVAIVNITHRRYGGTVYEEMLADVLSDDFEVELISTGVRNKGKLRYLEAPFVLERLFRATKRKDFDILIRGFEASLFLNEEPVKNIILVHEIDSSYKPIILKIFYPILKKIILNNLKRSDAIVTVSKYWEDYLKGKGYKNIHTIYNGFDLTKFKFSSEEILEFKRKYNLSGRPIVYLGNCQKRKGVVESYHALKDLEAHLITSGRQEVEIPARNLNLDYRDYLRLLKASSVAITMSKLKEGWCRTAHEAMLCKTPVIGSGVGGMNELLEGGRQIVCPDFNYLKNKVSYLLDRPEIRKKIGKTGYSFAKDFTKEKFKKDWLNLIKRLK